MLFEMLVGYPPFFSENPAIICQKIINWKTYFEIPKEANLSKEAKNLINRLICSPNERLGVNGISEIKAHPFFYGINWKSRNSNKAAWVPELISPEDTQYFDKFESKID